MRWGRTTSDREAWGRPPEPARADAMAAGTSGMRVATFPPDAASPATARHFATRLIDEWGVGSNLRADVALCVTELATNAALHTRTPYTVTVRPAALGARIDVIDTRPDQLPVVVPLVGTVADLTARSTTGRGLLIVATLADRWGVSTSDGAKAVWAELSGHPHEGPSEPTIVVGHHPVPPEGNRLLYLDLPVRAAVASGIQTDEAARDVQLAELAQPTTGTPQARLLELLDESAPLRLAGRFAALRAAAEDEERFDLEVVVTDDSMRAVAKLSEQLSHLADVTSVPSEDYEPFRAWLADETIWQRRGNEPRPCPLPS